MNTYLLWSLMMQFADADAALAEFLDEYHDEENKNPRYVQLLLPF